MTQENKELLLKDLCCRLPYGVIIQVKDWAVFDTELKTGHINRLQINDIELKPYLFPLSSMTEEQEKEYAHILVMCSNLANCQLLGMTVEDWFRKNHFDVYGLIPMGLAIDATDKNVY